MTRYLLDTNIVSQLIRNPRGPVTERVRQVGATRVCTSVIVAAELRFSADKSGSPILIERVDSVLATIEVVPFAPLADRSYGELRAKLERTGRPIGANDLLIAAQAISLEYILVSDNSREFERIERLAVENWLST